MGRKNPSYCKHCDERGTVRVKRGDTFVMEKCRKCDGTGFKRSAIARFFQKAIPSTETEGSAE